MDKGCGSSCLGLVLSALINVRNKEGFLLGSKILNQLTVSACLNSAAPLIPVSLYCLERKVSAFSSFGPLLAGGLCSGVSVFSNWQSQMYPGCYCWRWEHQFGLGVQLQQLAIRVC